jgi:hypothetical protein
MEYIIFTIISLCVLWLYHRLKYLTSNYGEFEYYLIGETNWVITGLMLLWEILLVTAFVGAIIYSGGQIIKILIL